MAHSPRNLIRTIAAIVFGAFLLTTSSSAQTRGPDATFRVFSLAPDLSGLFYDHEKQQIALTTPHWSFSPSYPAPADGTIALYREEPPTPPETKPRRIPVVNLALGPGGPWLLFLTASAPAAGAPPQVVGRVFDYSWQAHPANSLRVFNFAETQVAAQLDQSAFTLAPAAVQTFPYPSGKNRFWFKAAGFIDGEWHVKISEPQRIRNGSRTTWVVLKLPFVEDEPEPNKLVVRKLTQNVPPPELASAR